MGEGRLLWDVAICERVPDTVAKRLRMSCVEGGGVGEVDTTVGWGEGVEDDDPRGEDDEGATEGAECGVGDGDKTSRNPDSELVDSSSGAVASSQSGRLEF